MKQWQYEVMESPYKFDDVINFHPIASFTELAKKS